MADGELTAQEQRETLSKAARKGRKAIEKTTRNLSTLEIVYLAPSAIKPNPWNPNRQSTHDFELLLRSMEEDGFTQPVVCVRITDADLEVDKIREAGVYQTGDVMIVDGEHRWRAGEKLGFPEIPVAITPMTAAQAMIATLRHNRARGSEDILLSADLLRDLEHLGAKEWALDSLAMEQDEWDRLVEDIAAPEALAAEQHSESWEPDSSVNPDGDELTVEGTSTEAPSGEWTKAATPQAVEAAREREERMAAAKTEEQREMVRRDTRRDFYRLSLVFSGDEAEMVKEALGGAQAVALVEMCAAKVGKERALAEDGWVTIDSVIGQRMIPAEAARVLAEAKARMVADGTINDRNAFQVIEYLAADYLGGA